MKLPRSCIAGAILLSLFEEQDSSCYLDADSLVALTGAFAASQLQS
jgi:hypothetical protein